MDGLGIHGALFLVVAFAIVLLGTFHAEAGDGDALASFPRRALHFVFGCALLAAVVVVL